MPNQQTKEKLVVVYDCNENWVFDEQGLMVERYASINDLPIKEEERLLSCPQGR